MKKIFKKEEGFTIIEVVLVLAIAGLIFLVVFLALPQLQQSRRDSQRKSDAGRALAALESYAGNNNGAYPLNADEFLDEVVPAYLTNNGVWTDPSTGEEYDAGAEPTDLDTLEVGEFWYEANARCNGQTVETVGASGRDIVFVMYQESGGQYCQDNR